MAASVYNPHGEYKAENNISIPNIINVVDPNVNIVHSGIKIEYSKNVLFGGIWLMLTLSLLWCILLEITFISWYRNAEMFILILLSQIKLSYKEKAQTNF